MRFMKRILLLCFAAMFLYAAIAISYQFRTGIEMSPVLTERFYTVFGIELASLAALKIIETSEKIRQERKERKRQRKRKTAEQEARQREINITDSEKGEEE